MAEISGGGVSNRRRLVCRLRGHDDAVTVVNTRVGAAVLSCDRCLRRKAAPYRGAAVPTAERELVVQVDKEALALLQMSAAVDATIAAAHRRLLTGEPPP